VKIVILDGYSENPGDLSWDGFADLGDLTVYDRTPVANVNEVTARMIGAAAVITNKTPIRKENIETCFDLKYIGVLATGYDIVDVNTACSKGVTVCNVPTYGTEAVGQMAIALLLEICHHVGHHDQAVHNGKWADSPDWCFWDYPLIELAGKTIGIIGFGRIGQMTGKIAGSLGMKVLAFDERQNGSGKAIGEYVSFDRLLKDSDVIVLHCPLSPSTDGIINKETIAMMREGVIIINNSRGSLIREKDLADALGSGKVYAAGVDVVSNEPIKPDNPLLKVGNCIITPHISWAAKESRQRLMDAAVNNLRAFTEGKPINVIKANL
jgi:glycerate dehydrogenase